MGGLSSPAANVQNHKWVLDNGHVHRVVEFSPSSGLATVSWKDVDSGTEFMQPARPSPWQCQEFRMMVDSTSMTGLVPDVALAGEAAVVHRGAWQELDVHLRALKALVNIVVHYAIYDGFAASRQWITIENTGDKPVVLRNLAFQCQTMQAGPTRDLIAFGHYGEQPRETYLTARVDDPAILVEDAKTGVGLAVLNEAPGNLRRTETAMLWQPEIKSMYDTDLFPFERTLQPGEKFESAGTSIVFYRRGTTFDPHWILPEYVRAAIAHNKNTEPAEWIYNDWDPWHGAATADMLQEFIVRAAGAKLDLFTIDEGWESVLGDNEPDPTKFPHGLEPVFESMTQHGLKRGLWLTVALVSQKSKVYREHPEWVCRGRNGKPKQSQGQGVVMCLASPYREAAFGRIAAAVRRYRLDYVKLDLTTVFNAYGEEPGCYETGDRHEHASPQEASVRDYEALGWIANQLHAEFPSLLIDYTYELWGEKHVIDYGLLRVADLDWLANVRDRTLSDAGPIQVRTVIYQRGMAIPVEDMIVGNMHLELPNWKEQLTTAMAMTPPFLGDLREISDRDLLGIAAWIGRFRALRQRVALNDSFFPLGSWQQPRVDRWDGYGRFARSGEGILAIFRNESNQTDAEISIPGFPDGDFRVIDWNGGPDRRATGAQMRTGWRIPLSGPDRVLVLEVRKKR